MSQEEYQVCDACGVTAEMGYVISEGDDVAEVQIFAQSNEEASKEFERYLSLAKTVNPNVMHDFGQAEEVFDSQVMVKLKFECSAEKLIFELKSRSIAR